ncbi:hypothetical protein [Ichthyenterobacterium magnum]|uniref:Uncharacterized protein n=1 Tax=Ichthyenterobacterium magnum TaxID=1230530 RepID=A0A420DMN5_9FLAO|nr:hypothetical protein [Ichthyenterobacterium magnum]RKE95465.1 hypothetical protein BXY80_1657 [Ichthyenterobacterium magnum]
MTRTEFKKHIDKTLSELKLYAELHAGMELPNEYEFEWQFADKPKAVGKENVTELIAERVYLNENKIYPCVDLIVEKITDENRILISGRIAGYEPREFGKGWSNRPGPFIYGIGNEILTGKINCDSKEFKNMLYEKGLLHYKTE